MGRAPCCEKVGLKKGRWTTEEDEILMNYIQANGEGSWRSLPKNAGLLRCGKSCRLRWINYLRADLKRGNISAQEEHIIIKLHASLGNRWSLIATQLPGRTDNEIKNYWNSHLSRRIDTFRRPIATTATAAAALAGDGGGDGVAPASDNKNMMETGGAGQVPNDIIPLKRRGGRISRWAMKKNKIYATQTQHKGHEVHNRIHNYKVNSVGDDDEVISVEAEAEKQTLPMPQVEGDPMVLVKELEPTDDDDDDDQELKKKKKKESAAGEAVAMPMRTNTSSSTGEETSLRPCENENMEEEEEEEDRDDKFVGPQCAGTGNEFIDGAEGLLGYNYELMDNIELLDPSGLLFSSDHAYGTHDFDDIDDGVAMTRPIHISHHDNEDVTQHSSSNLNAEAVIGDTQYSNCSSTYSMSSSMSTSSMSSLMAASTTSTSTSSSAAAAAAACNFDGVDEFGGAGGGGFIHGNDDDDELGDNSLQISLWDWESVVQAGNGIWDIHNHKLELDDENNNNGNMLSWLLEAQETSVSVSASASTAAVATTSADSDHPRNWEAGETTSSTHNKFMTEEALDPTAHAHDDKQKLNEFVAWILS